MALLLEKPELIDNAVEECLRYHGPGIVSFVRFATQDTEIGGTRILKDMPVYASPQAAGFDASEFEDPHQFDIRRKPRSEEHTSKLQSLMRISYAVLCLKKQILKNARLTAQYTQYII